MDERERQVLLLTNDGDLASKLTHPKFLKKKVYHVHLDKNPKITNGNNCSLVAALDLDILCGG